MTSLRTEAACHKAIERDRRGKKFVLVVSDPIHAVAHAIRPDINARARANHRRET
jgi:hypothetical protein